MTVSAKRLTELLTPLGFHFWFESSVSWDIMFSRPSLVDDLFEHILVSRYGDRHRTIGSDSIVSVTIGPELSHVFSVRRPHLELCSVRERHFSEVSNLKEAIEWEKSLAAFIDQDLRSLVEEEGPELLKRSETTRKAAVAYWLRLRQLNQETNCDYLATQLRTGLSRDQLIEPDRIADAIVGNLRMLSAYQAAAMTIQMFAQDVEGIHDPFVGRHVYENDALWSLLAILADLILREDVELCSNF